MSADIYVRIGAAIRRRRSEAGLTQATLASAAGLSRSSITNIESGGQAILLHQLLDIARALNSDPCEFLTSGTSLDQNDRDKLAGALPGRATQLLAQLGPSGRSRSR